MYKTQIVNQMNENYFNPKTFWLLLNKLKPSKAADNAHIKSISPKQWLNHFGTLLFNNDCDTQDHLIHDDPDSFLNAPVSKDEINLVLKKLKNRKAAGLDQLSNEMIKTFGSLYTEFLSKLFSKILHEHKFPTLWITGLLLPQGVYSDVYMTGGLGLGIFWDTQKNKYQEKSDPKNKFMKITDPKK